MVNISGSATDGSGTNLYSSIDFDTVVINSGKVTLSFNNTNYPDRDRTARRIFGINN